MKCLRRTLRRGWGRKKLLSVRDIHRRGRVSGQHSDETSGCSGSHQGAATGSCAACWCPSMAKDLADLSYDAAKAALEEKKIGQVAPNIKNAAQLTGNEMSSNKTHYYGHIDMSQSEFGTTVSVFDIVKF